MKLRTKIASVFGAAMLAFGLGGATFAQETDTININIVIGEATGGGTLTFNVSQTIPFPAVAFSLADREVQGGMTWSVEDTRGRSLGWNLTASATNFTAPGTDDIIPVTNMSVDAGAVTVIAGTASPLPIASDLAPVTNAPQTFFSAPANSGNGRYAFTTATTVVVPGGTDIGTYTSTVTATLTSAPTTPGGN